MRHRVVEPSTQFLPYLVKTVVVCNPGMHGKSASAGWCYVIGSLSVHVHAFETHRLIVIRDRARI